MGKGKGKGRRVWVTELLENFLVCNVYIIPQNSTVNDSEVNIKLFFSCNCSKIKPNLKAGYTTSISGLNLPRTPPTFMCVVEIILPKLKQHVTESASHV